MLYIDYGNRASVPKTKLGSLPAAFTGTGGYAKLYSLALVSLPQVIAQIVTKLVDSADVSILTLFRMRSLQPKECRSFVRIFLIRLSS